MKKHYITLITALCLAMSGQSFAAAPTFGLKVIGEISVPGCEVAMSGGNEYDLGKISPTQIKAGTAHTALPPITKDMTVTCDGSTFLTFSVVDAEEASSSGTAATDFGMGMVNTTGKLGYYKVNISEAKIIAGQAAEQDARVFSSNTAAITPAVAVDLSRGDFKMGWASLTANALAAATIFKAKFTVAPQLGGTTTMNGPVTDETKIAGSLTLNFAFGL